MKKIAVIFVLGLFFSPVFFSLSTAGGHGGWHGHGWHGGWHGHYYGWYGPRWGAYPYYYYPCYVYADPSLIYASDPVPDSAEPQQSFWYYCRDPKGYYPYVTNCPEGWVQVVPIPPPSETEGGAR